MRNIIVSINVGFRETDNLATENDGVERMDDGSFRMVLDPQAEFNIDRLENALLHTSYLALRQALSDGCDLFLIFSGRGGTLEKSWITD